MKKTINENLISFSGKGHISKELNLGVDVNIKIQGGVITVEDRDNQDGTFDRVYKIKVITSEII